MCIIIMLNQAFVVLRPKIEPQFSKLHTVFLHHIHQMSLKYDVFLTQNPKNISVQKYVYINVTIRKLGLSHQ